MLIKLGTFDYQNDFKAVLSYTGQSFILVAHTGKKSRSNSFFSRVLNTFQERISQVVNLGSNKLTTIVSGGISLLILSGYLVKMVF